MTEATSATAMTLNHSENLTKQVEKRLVDNVSPDTQLLGFSE